MENNKWDDKEIEKLLSEMPKVDDKRSKDTILARLKADERLQKPRKRKKSFRWLPASVAIASILVLSLLLPSMLRETDEYAESTAGSKRLKVSIEDKEAVEADTEAEAEASIPVAMEEKAEGYASNVLLSGELGERSLFQIGLVSDTNVIPVTFLIPKEQIDVDFPGAIPDVAQLYTKYAAAIPEEELGFDNYHPYKGEISIVNDAVIHHYTDDSGYDETPAMKELYTNTFQATFSNYPDLQIIEATQKLTKFNTQSKLSNRIIPGAYYKYVMPSGQLFLISQYDKDYTTVEKALFGMKNQPNSSVVSLVPEHVTYDIRVENGIVMISFQEALDLSKMQAADAMSMIEGFILTANHYHYVVQFENIVQESFGKYDLGGPLAEPIAVNPVEFIGER